MSNIYKETAYGYYHNTMIDIMQVLCTSATAQDKVDVVMNMIKNTCQDIAVNSYVITDRVKKKLKKGNR